MIMAKYECLVCGWIYNEDEKSVKFEDQPDDYICLVCGAPKDQFENIED